MQDPLHSIGTSWNIGAERLLGYAGDEIVGRTADVTFPPEAGGAEVVQKLGVIGSDLMRAPEWAVREHDGFKLVLAAPMTTAGRERAHHGDRLRILREML